MDKIKKFTNVLTITVFLLIIGGFCLWSFLLPDQAVSKAERRKLAQAPEFSGETVMNGSYFTSLDKYLADQFPLREEFRSLNTGLRLNTYAQLDVNGLYAENGVILKNSDPFNEKHVLNFSQVTNEIYRAHIAGKAVGYYVSVIPDKEYYSGSGHLNADAKAIADLFVKNLEAARYIDIFGGLNLQSYYKTDTHWSQDKLLPVMDALGSAMGFEAGENYEVNTLSPFYGVYWGQLAGNLPGEDLNFFTNDITAAATVENLQKPAVTTVYDTEAFMGTDGYDLFLSGATPLVTVTSPGSLTEKELVIFRDSFGSSIAPLFLHQYRKVTLVDLRYLSPKVLGDYVDFTGKDVLVLYSSLILNSSIVFK